MRLGQLARKLALRPTDIVEFLAENKIQIADNANTRIESDQETLIMKRFVPGWEEIKETQIPTGEVEQVIPEAINTEEPAQLPEIPVAFDNDVVQTPEVIKAPKIELTGLKVLGKIDLPEPKKKEIIDNPEAIESTTPEIENSPRKEERRRPDERRRREYRPEKNPIALQREREAKEEQRKLQEQIARDKERKTQNYLKKVKVAVPTKAVRLVKEHVIQMTAQELEEPPKTLWGKIVNWLTKAN